MLPEFFVALRKGRVDDACVRVVFSMLEVTVSVVEELNGRRED